MPQNKLLDDKYFDISEDKRFSLVFPDEEKWERLIDVKTKHKGCLIYSLKCREHYYIGSDGDGDRFASHKSNLKHKNHQNYFLQNLCNKYGIENIFYSVICVIPEEFIIYRNQIENSYIKLFNTYIKDNPKNLNLAQFASVPNLGKELSDEEKIKRGAKKVILINPEGEVVEGVSIHEVSKKYNLYRQGISKLIRGDKDIYHVKGWRKYSIELIGVKFNNEDRKTGKNNAKPFEIISPDGILIKGINLNKFCKENNLDQGGIWHLLKGDINVYKGYKSP